MKKRHVIMILILAFFALIMFSIKESKNTKKLTCTVKSDFHGMDSDITLKVKVRDNEIKDMDIYIDSTLSEEYKDQKQYLMNTLSADGRMQVISTKDGIRLKTGINSDYFKTLGLSTNTSYSELKEVLEFQGYTCK